MQIPLTSPQLVRGAEMRVAETRAVNRALRKAYGIGLCSVEELGSLSDGSSSLRESDPLPETSTRAMARITVNPACATNFVS